MDKYKCKELEERITKLEIKVEVARNEDKHMKEDIQILIRTINETEESRLSAANEIERARRNRDWAIMIMLLSTVVTVLAQYLIK